MGLLFYCRCCYCALLILLPWVVYNWNHRICLLLKELRKRPALKKLKCTCNSRRGTYQFLSKQLSYNIKVWLFVLSFTVHSLCTINGETSKLYCSMMANTKSRMHTYRGHKINPFIWTHSIFFVLHITMYKCKSKLLLAIMVLDILHTRTKIYVTKSTWIMAKNIMKNSNG